MITLLIAFFTSLISNILILGTQKIHLKFSGDHELNRPQKFHKKNVPRIGGLAISIGMFVSIATSYHLNNTAINIFFIFYCSLPIFGIGILEDINKNISVKTRIFVITLGALLTTFILDCKISGIEIFGIDILALIPGASIIFTAFAITGLTNAYNIIDGVNGLSSMIGIIALLAISYISFQFEDHTLIMLTLTMVGAIFGFFLLNYPRGYIFLGDGGAYLIGFWVSISSILLINRHQEISPWFALLVNAYPTVETLFTIYRRKFYKGVNPGNPDGVHFHSLIFRRIVPGKNSQTAPYLWILSSTFLIPGLFFYRSTPIMILSCLIFVISYLCLYKRIVTFRRPKWMQP